MLLKLVLRTLQSFGSPYSTIFTCGEVLSFLFLLFIPIIKNEYKEINKV